MKKCIIIYCLCIVFAICVTTFLAACSKNTESTIPTEDTYSTVDSAHTESTIPTENTVKYYSMEDFESIVIGESTLLDVEAIADFETLAATSFGAFCEFPTEDGKYIRIEFFHGKASEMKVRSIYIIEP